MANINSFSSLVQLFNPEQHEFNPRKPFNLPARNEEVNPSAPKSEVSLSDKNKIGVSAVYQSFASKFASFSSFEQTHPLDQETEEETSFFDYEKVANNVLDFIGSSIKAAANRGADTSKLESMFEQAREGVEQGFDEAKDQLTELNLLDDDLEQGIETSRDLINEGIDKLQQNILSPNEDTESDNESVKPNDDDSFIRQTAPAFAAQYQSETYQSQSMSSDLMIETADGDLVTISFSHLQEYASMQSASYGTGDGYQYMSYGKSSESYQELNFSFSIEGSLDEDEQKAIGDLIKDINKLQKEFFEGDIDKAFKQALKLGFDSSELSGFSLNLEKTTTSIASQAYQEISQVPVNQNDLAQYTRPLFDFADQFSKVQQQSAQLLNSQVEQLQQLMDQVFDMEFGHMEDNMARLNKFNSFIENLK